MSRVFLVSLNTCSHPFEVYPLGLAIIAESCRRLGHDVRQHDYLAAGKDQARLIAEAKNYQPDVIGISLRNLDDNVDGFNQTGNAAKFAWIGEVIRQLKGAAAAPVVLGGSAFSLMPEVILDLTGADFGIVGEGDRAFTRLVAVLRDGGPADRIINGSQPYLQGCDIGAGLYDPSLVRYYCQQSDMVGIQTKRGCPFRCVYCTYPFLEGSSFRYRDEDDVIDELARLKRDHHCSNFFFTDSVFNDPAGRYRQLLEAIVVKELGIRWTAYFTPYGLTRDDVDLCKRAGLFAVELGTDASSDTTLAGLNKAFLWNDVVKANDNVVHAQIPCAHSVVFGGPDETLQTLQEGIENCRRLHDCVVFGFGGIRIYPASPLRKRALDEGIVSEHAALIEPAYYFSPSIDPAEMNDMICRAWNKERRLLFPPAKAEMMSQAAKRMFNMKGLIWDKIGLLK